MTYEAYEDVNLSEYDDQFNQAEEPGFDNIPDGKYQVNVKKAEITKAKTSGNPMLKWTLKIIGPTQINRLLWTYHVLNNSIGQSWLKKDLNLCDIHLNKLSDLPKNLENLLDVKLEVTVRTRDDSTNVYFNRRLADNEVPEVKDDGTPF